MTTQREGTRGELVLLRDLERLVRAGHQPIAEPRPGQPKQGPKHVPCAVCEIEDELDALRRRAA